MSVDPQRPAHRIIAMIARTGTQPDDVGSVVRIAAAVAAPTGATVEALVLGAATEEDARQAALAGATDVRFAQHPDLTDEAARDPLVSAFALALAHPDMTGDGRPALCLFAATPAGEEMAARLAVRLNGAALGRCTDVTLLPDGLIATSAVCGGRARLTTSYDPVWCFGAMRTTAGQVPAEVAGVPSRPPTILRLDGSLPESVSRIRRTLSDAHDTPLEHARIVVSGGRGIGGAEGFALLRELSEILGAALGGSLPTVDAGWIPVARQIGQSGKFVTPEIYLAVALSGTLQHLAGIGPAARIAAINSDAEADIFRFAEIGIVGDWRVVVPALVTELKRQTKAAPS